VAEKLTVREVEVLERVVEGDTNKEIAEALFIAENTVKIHLRNILEKLHLRNRIQAAVYAVREGLVGERPSGLGNEPAGILASGGGRMRSASEGCQAIGEK
jgi:DNA-binding CsgD family transcriptional regulator